jgi:flagellar basal body rod protein FlgB
MDKTINLLTKALFYGFERQAVIAHNIANHNTPGFKTLDLAPQFESSEGASMNPYEMRVGKIFTPLYTGVTNLDGNNVNIEMESLKSMYATIYTQTILDFLRSKYDMLKSAITERVA